MARIRTHTSLISILATTTSSISLYRVTAAFASSKWQVKAKNKKIIATHLFGVSGTSNIPIFYDSTNSLHRTIEYHTEIPSRIDVCVDELKKHQREQNKNNKYHLIDVASRETSSEIDNENAQNNNDAFFSKEELDRARNVLVRVHSETYVSTIETACRAARQRRIDEGRTPLGFVGNIDADTFLTTESYDVCLRAAAGWLKAVDHVLLSNSENNENLVGKKEGTFAMALTRPPGHHATKTTANGFCLFNFAAAATLHALDVIQNTTITSQNTKRHAKVSVLDWDVHYGQGVADILKQYPNQTRYASMHQTPAFPYEGESRGIEGNIMTIPIQAGSTWDSGYSKVYREDLLPFLCSQEKGWVPDLVVICAGYDALASDPLASVNLTPEDYGTMVRLLKDHLQSEGGGDDPPKLVLGLEGGYQLSRDGTGLSTAVLETILAL